MRVRSALIISLFFAILGAAANSAAQKSTEPLTYQSGRALCASERGAWLKVPYQYKLQLDTQNQRYEMLGQDGETEIFYRIYSDGQNNGAFLRPGKPSILYFEGGPAGVAATRDEFFKRQSRELDVNIITFEVRGVSCSRPESYNAYRDPNLYSGLFIAADAKRLVDQLGVQEVLVYGLSYGTFPARVFGYLYPESTKSILLEGTLPLEQGQRAPGAPLLESIKALYSELFYSSPPQALQLFAHLTKAPSFPNWMDAYLSNLSRAASYQGARGVEQYFADLEARSENWEEFNKLIAWYPVSSPWRSVTGPGGEENLDPLVFEMYLCRDFDRSNSLSSTAVTINKEGLTAAKENGGFSRQWDHYLQTSCLEQKLPADQTFDALLAHHGGQLPLEDPVLMINGGLDTITPSLTAQQEAKALKTERLTFLEFENEGHAPWNLIELYGTDEQKAFVQNLLKGWVRSGDVDLSLEDFEFMQRSHIQHIPVNP